MRNRWWIVLIVILILIIIGIIVWGGRASAPSEGSQVSASNTVNYSCLDNKTIQAVYTSASSTPPAKPGEPPTPNGSVALTLSDGRTMKLPQAISGSGIRYANADDSVEFWSEGNGAFLMENNQQTYSGCVAVAPDPGGLPNAFASGSEGFSIRYPEGYTVKEGYQYQELGPGENIGGVKFTIASTTAAGTNLASDTYLSVESIPNGAPSQSPTPPECSASRFLPGSTTPQTLTQNGMTYSFASTTGAGAGNRYEEWVYAFPEKNTCDAVRYFIHYAVLQNYPAGSVKQFDQSALISTFDKMRQTLTLI